MWTYVLNSKMSEFRHDSWEQFFNKMYGYKLSRPENFLQNATQKIQAMFERVNMTGRIDKLSYVKQE